MTSLFFDERKKTGALCRGLDDINSSSGHMGCWGNLDNYISHLIGIVSGGRQFMKGNILCCSQATADSSIRCVILEPSK
jgi:hypothetical protein